jgi:hypothetical protein
MPRHNRNTRRIVHPHIFINFRLLGHKLGLNPIQRVKLAKELQSVLLKNDGNGGEN